MSVLAASMNSRTNLLQDLRGGPLRQPVAVSFVELPELGRIPASIISISIASY